MKNLIIVVHQLLTAEVALEVIKIEINGIIGGRFFIRNRSNIIHDSRDQNIALIVHQSVHHVYQISHGFMPRHFFF